MLDLGRGGEEVFLLRVSKETTLNNLLLLERRPLDVWEGGLGQGQYVTHDVWHSKCLLTL